MNYKITFRVWKDFLRVNITGLAGAGNLASISSDVNDIVSRYGITRILVDGRQAESNMGVFESIEHIGKYPEEMKKRRYAILDKPENKRQNDFFENAAVNRGFNIFFFYSEAEALKWLKIEDHEQLELVLDRVY